MLGPLAGGLAGALTGGLARAAGGPPPLGNGRHQFTEVDPVRPLPAISLPDRRGRLRPLRPAAGRVGLLHIWATWCPACRAELAALRDALDGGALAAGALVTVATDEGPPATVERFLQAAGLADLPVLLDPGGRTLIAPGLDGDPFAVPPLAVPITYLADASGGVRGYIAGPVDWRGADARALLAFYAGS